MAGQQGEEQRLAAFERLQCCRVAVCYVPRGGTEAAPSPCGRLRLLIQQNERTSTHVAVTEPASQSWLMPRPMPTPTGKATENPSASVHWRRKMITSFRAAMSTRGGMAEEEGADASQSKVEQHS